MALPNIRATTFSVPNGARTSIAEAIWLKREGLTKSIPDVFISVPNKDYFGFYIEFKAGNNVASDEQLAMHRRLRALGYKVEVIYKLEDCINQVKKYIL